MGDPSSVLFFGAGAAILTPACVSPPAIVRRAPGSSPSLARLGFRNARAPDLRARDRRHASATFILISVDAFRLGDVDPSDRRSGTGGYPVLVDLMLPIVHDPNSKDGRQALGLDGRTDITIEPFRVLPGDDTSCPNLYEPTKPRILGVGRRVIDAGRFSFQASLAASDAERANPWLLLTQTLPEHVIPIAADANSLTYVLHKTLGDEILLAHGGRPVRLRLVAALRDSVFQGELLMADANFTALFPEQQGYRFLMIDGPAAPAREAGDAIERGAGFGADATPPPTAPGSTRSRTPTSRRSRRSVSWTSSRNRRARAVLLRNVLERRRRLALLPCGVRARCSRSSVAESGPPGLWSGGRRRKRPGAVAPPPSRGAGSARGGSWLLPAVSLRGWYRRSSPRGPLRAPRRR